MRPIKFRAWDEEEKTMLDISHWTLSMLNEDRMPIMQFTGLKDKKRTEEYPEGQEIWEGDIVKGIIDGEEHIWEVCWETDDMLGWSIDNTNEPFEVIGNIHSNPELIEEKE